ncbi:MAG: PAS domain-containing protein, partial [Myxococcales bacterium]|nr:PAS domain-containing protein [Myxococcales bacterium]
YCFTPERLEALHLIAGQAAGALENARLYAALRQSEARWRSLVDSAPDVIALLNERGEIEFVNRPSLLELRSKEGIRLLEMLLSRSSAQRWQAAVDRVLREGVELELELEVVREGRPTRWFAARLAPIELDEPSALAPADPDDSRRLRRNAIAIATDITERKLAELEKAGLETQLRQQQRLESLGTLASGVAHEINNPVQGIMNYAELIAGNTGDVETVLEFADEITIEAQRVATIVRNLLAFSRQEREQTM